jgi:hypothetical protein
MRIEWALLILLKRLGEEMVHQLFIIAYIYLYFSTE